MPRPVSRAFLPDFTRMNRNAIFCFFDWKWKRVTPEELANTPLAEFFIGSVKILVYGCLERDERGTCHRGIYIRPASSDWRGIIDVIDASEIDSFTLERSLARSMRKMSTAFQLPSPGKTEAIRAEN